MGYFYQDYFQTGFSHTASYTYDNVNRLTEAAASPAVSGTNSYTQNYSLDQFGNMTCTSGCANMPANLAFNVANNQINSSNYTYDLAGNLTKDSSNGTAHTYQWDAEGRVSKVDSGSTWTFTYDALGDRVVWVSGGVTSNALFDPAGNWLGVAGSYDFVMLGSRPLLVYTTSDTYFHHVNNIGSSTMMTAHYGNVTQDMVFYPWGDEWLNWGGGGLEFADIGWDDTTTGSQLTPNRLLSGNLGRWHSPDPLGGDIANPQSLNLYAYVMNDPTALIDPLGLYSEQCSQSNDPYCCNDPTSVGAQCGSSGDPPGFWPPYGGGGEGGGGASLPTPTPAANPGAQGDSLVSTLPCLSDQAIAALAQTLMNVLNRVLGTHYSYNSATVWNVTEGVTLNVDVTGRAMGDVPVPQNLPDGAKTGATSCIFHPDACSQFPNSIRLKIDPKLDVPSSGAPTSFPDDWAHIMYGTDASGQINAIRIHGDVGSTKGLALLSHIINFLVEQTGNGGCIEKFD
jgi:RHS repeat-associated protein